MAVVEYQGHSFEVDEDGFLQKFEDWTPERTGCGRTTTTGRSMANFLVLSYA